MKRNRRYMSTHAGNQSLQEAALPGCAMNNSNSNEKWLFVCSRNKRRSLTAEKMLDGLDGLQVRSAGTQPGARIALSCGLIGWADIIFWMEKSHLNRARERFKSEIEAKENVVLHVLDDFEWMQIELIEELRAKLENYLEWPTET